MELTAHTIEGIAPLLIGRSGKQIVRVFNEHGALDKYDELGLPDIGKKSGQRPSKTQYVEHRLNELSGNSALRSVLTDLISDLSDNAIDKLNSLLGKENLKIVKSEGQFVIQGGVTNAQVAVENNPHFEDIQNQILAVLDNAQVSILVAIAWFTNQILFDKLLEKAAEGVSVHVAIFDDGINSKHGVDISQIHHSKIRGSRKGLMHNKFCVVDNQIVITGSYNWSTNAETRNDENITVQNDPMSATKYSVEFRRLIG